MSGATRISDYALIGDCHSAALVTPNGSIDWVCFPRFDSPATFCAVLDEDRGGHFQIRPDSDYEATREYLPETNVLCTSFETDLGMLEVTDCMPVGRFDPNAPTRVDARGGILRRVHCSRGKVTARVQLAPRFEYGRFVPRFRVTSDRTSEIVGGADALWVTSSRPLIDRREHLEARWPLSEGETVWIYTHWSPSSVVPDPDSAPSDTELEGMLDDTIAFWRDWLAQGWYQDRYPEQVRRSALVLKALVYAPTGAVVAAPTTSLPESIGGSRNWDYRYTWIRDATLTLISMNTLGFFPEADAFKVWLERTGAGRPEDLQIMYGITGRRSLPELELSHLGGHRDSKPVRIGNGAATQMQLDAYGQIIVAGYLYGKLGGELTESNWQFLAGLADIICARWQKPDHGIWEMRDEPRHFVHSKLYCWVGLDRAVKMARAFDLKGAVDLWERERDAVRNYLLADADRCGWFAQAVGFENADASTLLVPAMGLLPPNDPRVKETVRRVRERLEKKDGLILRYDGSDGLDGDEGAFLLCSFWLIDALIHAGDLEEGRRMVEMLLGLTNDVGLYPEEVDMVTGEHLGNFPQAFTHMALVASCGHLAAAEAGQLPEPGEDGFDFAEAAIDRLLARRGLG